MHFLCTGTQLQSRTMIHTFRRIILKWHTGYTVTETSYPQTRRHVSTFILILDTDTITNKKMWRPQTYNYVHALGAGAIGVFTLFFLVNRGTVIVRETNASLCAPLIRRCVWPRQAPRDGCDDQKRDSKLALFSDQESHTKKRAAAAPQSCY